MERKKFFVLPRPRKRKQCRPLQTWTSIRTEPLLFLSPPFSTFSLLILGFSGLINSLSMWTGLHFVPSVHAAAAKKLRHLFPENKSFSFSPPLFAQRTTDPTLRAADVAVIYADLLRFVSSFKYKICLFTATRFI